MRRHLLTGAVPATDGDPALTQAPATPPPAGASPATGSASRPEPVPAPTDRRRRRRGLLPALVGALVVALVVVIVALVLQSDPQDLQNSTPIDAPTNSAPPTSGSSSTTSSTPPTTSGPKPRAAAMTTFVTSYLNTAPTNPDEAFAYLTPDFQQASGGEGQYAQFWGDVRNVQIRSLEADPSALTVSYVYSYRKPGLGQRTDHVTLMLDFKDGQYLIAGEADGA